MFASQKDFTFDDDRLPEQIQVCSFELCYDSQFNCDYESTIVEKMFSISFLTGMILFANNQQQLEQTISNMDFVSLNVAFEQLRELHHYFNQETVRLYDWSRIGDGLEQYPGVKYNCRLIYDEYFFKYLVIQDFPQRLEERYNFLFRSLYNHNKIPAIVLGYQEKRQLEKLLKTDIDKLNSAGEILSFAKQMLKHPLVNQHRNPWFDWFFKPYQPPTIKTNLINHCNEAIKKLQQLRSATPSLSASG